MAIQVASISETLSKDVFTDRGKYCGKIEDLECDLRRFKIRSLVVRALKGSYLTNMLGGKKGLIIPYPMLRAISDVVIVKHISTPMAEEVSETGAAEVPEGEEKPEEAAEAGS